MIKNFLTFGLIAAVGAGCATVTPSPLTADDPSSPEAPSAEQIAEPPALLAGSEPLAQWLATNRVDATHDDHSQHHHGHAPATKPASKPAAKEHHH